jgi:hypothetical protein
VGYAIDLPDLFVWDEASREVLEWERVLGLRSNPTPPADPESEGAEISGAAG